MAASNLTLEMNRQAILVALTANHSNSDIATFLNEARPFVFKVRKQLPKNGGDVLFVAKRKKHSQWSDVVRTAEFIQQVQELINDDPSKSMRAIANQLQLADPNITFVFHEDIRYKSYVMRKGQFMSDKARENCVIRSKCFLNKLKHPEKPGMLWFFSDEKNFDQDKNVNRRKESGGPH